MISVYRLFKSAYDRWSDREAPRLGASVAFYAIFSITPLVLMTVTVAGLFVDATFARKEFLEELQGLLGNGAADAVRAMIEAAAQASHKGPWAGVTSAVALLAGASGVFIELRYALDAIHDNKRGRDGFVSWFMRGRLWSFALVLAVGFLLLVSLIASAVIAAMGAWLTVRFPVLGFVAIGLNLLLSLGVLTVLFGMLMRWLPSRRRSWRNVWGGALLAAALLEAGKELLGLYLGRAAFADAYGAAGGLVVLVMWIYFSVQVFLFGAAFNEIRSRSSKREAVQPEPSVPTMRRVREGL